MTLVEKRVRGALTEALREEIVAFRSSGKGDMLREETFDPLSQHNCFVGQTNQQSLISMDSGYRQNIGDVPKNFELGGFGRMTPLEVWSAYWWKKDKDKVLSVFNYIKGKSDILPEVEYSEA